MTFCAQIEGQILRHFLMKESLPLVATFEVGLVYGVTGWPWGEWLEPPPENGYERVLMADTAWGFAADGVIMNISPVVFPVATGPWGSATYPIDGWVMWGGTVEFFTWGNTYATGRMDVPKVVETGEVAILAPGAMRIAQDGTGTPIGLTDYAEDVILNHMFSKVFHAAPDIWVGLLQGPASEKMTNTNCYELPFINGYQRVRIDPDQWMEPVPENPQAEYNISPVVFPVATGPWGEVNFFGLFDVATPAEEGHLLIYGDTPYWDVQTGYRPAFEPYSLWIYFSE